jgi:hypothetical protein
MKISIIGRRELSKLQLMVVALRLEMVLRESQRNCIERLDAKLRGVRNKLFSHSRCLEQHLCLFLLFSERNQTLYTAIDANIGYGLWHKE